MSTWLGLPGLRSLSMPSSPAAMIPACSRYGFTAPSASRSSKRPGSGMRTMWVRLLPDQVTVFGAHVAPEAVTGALMRL